MYPRRYISNAGTPTLIGLSAEETREFEALDGQDPLGTESLRPGHRERLLALYLKHQAAYDKMMSDDAASG